MAAEGDDRASEVSELLLRKHPTLVAGGSNRHPIHPGEILREEFLEPLEIPQTRLAKQLGIPLQSVNET